MLWDEEGGVSKLDRRNRDLYFSEDLYFRKGTNTSEGQTAKAGQPAWRPCRNIGRKEGRKNLI